MEIEPNSTWRWVAFLSCLFFLQPLTMKATAHNSCLDDQVNYVIDFAEDEVKERLQQLDQSLLEHRFDNSVRDIIAMHLRYGQQTARNVGRAVALFPIFEAELTAAGLPEALKYLPVIESALRPQALSPVGAQGLWQFMPATAPEYGLLIDEYVDERLDTYRATQGAIKYLANAYEYLGDWSLAIAAYNAGKGGVRRAMGKGNGKDFWAIRKNLPRETRNYVPAFIAAIYLTEFYAAHGIEPILPSLDEQLIERVTVYRPLSFYRIAQVTGLSIELIQNLNMGYQKGFLPGYANGHNLVLPQRVMPAMRTYLSKYPDVEDEAVLPWAKVLQLPAYKPADATNYETYMTASSVGDSLALIASYLQIPATQLAIWNNITPLDSLQEGQELRYFRPAVYKELPQRLISINSNWRAPSITSVDQLKATNIQARPLPTRVCKQLYISLEQKEKPSDIVARYPYLEMSSFMANNDLLEDKILPAGSIVRISRK